MGGRGQDVELLTQVIPRLNMDWDRAALRRRVEVDGVSRVWKRFVVLPYVEGQKYTIGENFTTREEQGEFIYLTQKQVTRLDKKGDPLCEIICNRNKFWVTPKMENSVFINGEDIGSNKMQIKFGDVLSFGEKILIGGSHEEEGHEIVRFLFKERELNPEVFHYSEARKRLTVRQSEQRMEKDAIFRALLVKSKEGTSDISGDEVGEISRRNNSDIMVGGNPLLVSHILSNLPLAELKHFRLVSKLWNDEAIRFVKKRSVVKLKYEKANSTSDSQPSKFFHYAQDMKNNIWPNLEIHHPNPSSQYRVWGEWEWNNFMKKWTSDLDWFLKTANHSFVTRLYLRGDIYSRLELYLRMQTLSQLQGSLVELELSGCCLLGHPNPNNHTHPIYQFPADLKMFAKLQKFTLSMHILGPDIPDTILVWIYPLIDKISGVKALSLPTDIKITLTVLEKLESFVNLEELRLEILNPVAMELLLKCKWNRPLKKLALKLWKCFNQDEINKFEELLAKHAKGLGSLHLVIPSAPPGYLGGQPIPLRLPAFPSLKELRVERKLDYSRRQGFNGALTHSAEALIKFGNDDRGIIDYALHFPLLQSLSLNADIVASQTNSPSQFHAPYSMVEEYRTFYKNFVPSDEGNDNVCKSLKRLSIFEGYLLPRYGSVPGAEEMSKMFPGVHNKWMNKAREPVAEPIPQMVLRSATRKLQM